MTDKFFPIRSQAAKAAQRAGHGDSFRTVRAPGFGWKFVTFAGKCPAAHEFAKGKDYVAWVEVGHIDEGRTPGYRGVLVVTCHHDELPSDIPADFDIEPVTPELFAGKVADEKPTKLSTGGVPRAKSEVASPTKLVWEIADRMKGEDREAVIEACVAAGVNKATASTQFYKWRRANNA